MLSLRDDFVASERWLTVVEPVEASLAVLDIAFVDVDRSEPIHDVHRFRCVRIFGVDGNDRTSSAKSFGIKMRVFLCDSCARERASQASGGGAEARTSQAGDQWTGREDGTDAWYRHRRERQEEAAETARGGARTDAFGEFIVIGRVVGTWAQRRRARTPFFIRCDQADSIVRKARGREFGQHAFGILKMIENSDDRSFHDDSSA